MTSGTLERETVATRSAREVEHLPAVWVSGTETDLGLSWPHIRFGVRSPSRSKDEGTPIVASAEFIGRSRWASDATGETIVGYPLGIGSASRRSTDVDPNLVGLFSGNLR